MKSLHIRDVPEATLRRLKQRAVRHRRSLQQEVRLVLDEAARMLPEGESGAAILNLNIVRSGNPGNRWSRKEIYGDDGR